MTSAIDADDVEAFASLYGMYQDSLANLQKSSSSNSMASLNTTQQNQLAKLQSAGSAIDELESLFEKAGTNLSGHGDRTQETARGGT